MKRGLSVAVATLALTASAQAWAGSCLAQYEAQAPSEIDAAFAGKNVAFPGKDTVSNPVFPFLEHYFSQQAQTEGLTQARLTQLIKQMDSAGVFCDKSGDVDGIEAILGEVSDIAVNEQAQQWNPSTSDSVIAKDNSIWSGDFGGESVNQPVTLYDLNSLKTATAAAQ